MISRRLSSRLAVMMVRQDCWAVQFEYSVGIVAFIVATTIEYGSGKGAAVLSWQRALNVSILGITLLVVSLITWRSARRYRYDSNYKVSGDAFLRMCVTNPAAASLNPCATIAETAPPAPVGLPSEQK